MLERILQSLQKCEQFEEYRTGKACVRIEDVEKVIRDEILKERTGNDDFTVKAAGVTRRVDDLGRIVIPKEIRQVLGIVEGTPMELFLSENGIYMEKHSYKTKAADLVRSLSEMIDSAEMELGLDKAEKIQAHMAEIWKLIN